MVSLNTLFTMQWYIFWVSFNFIVYIENQRKKQKMLSSTYPDTGHHTDILYWHVGIDNNLKNDICQCNHMCWCHQTCLCQTPEDA
jgi:hypothetical protein